MSEQKYTRRWGDRRDGRWVRDVPGLQVIMAHMLPNRTDCECYMQDSFDVTELLPFLEEKNARHPEYKTTVFHALLIAAARMVKERPKMNRFIQGRRIYERYEISLAFVAKRRFQDNGEEALMFFVPGEDETLDSLSVRVVGKVAETRRSATSTDGIDAVIDGFAKIPRLVLMPVLRVIRWLDFWGVNPKALTDGDPNYSTIFLSNLGSIKAPAVYHHLNNTAPTASWSPSAPFTRKSASCPTDQSRSAMWWTSALRWTSALLTAFTSHAVSSWSSTCSRIPSCSTSR